LATLLAHLGGVAGRPVADDLTIDDVEVTALHTVSTAVAVAALHREESRGCHRRSDFGAPRSEWARHVTWRLVDDHLVIADRQRRDVAA